MQKRLKKLRQKLKEADYEAILITKAENRYYLSGFSGSAGQLLITDSDAFLLTDFRYYQQAAKESENFKMIKIKDKSLNALKKMIDRLGLKELAFEAKSVSYEDYKAYKSSLGVELKASKNLVEQLRMIKDQTEIEKIKKAVEITDNAFLKVIEGLKGEITERELALKLEFEQKMRGAEKNAFNFIVASGNRSALPHGVASGKKIGANELVTIDLGAVYQGYHSDMTRTIFTGKQPNKEQQEIYQVVLKAQQQALAKMKAGIKGSQVDGIARDVIASAGYGDYFGHGLGHSLGLEIHESPRLSKQDDTVLQEGMVVTVEPGIYLPEQQGVRIEDLVVIKEDGIVNLTKSEKEIDNLQFIIDN